MDVGDDQAVQATPGTGKPTDGCTDQCERVLRAHAAVDHVDALAVRQEEAVDVAVLPGDGKPELEDSSGGLGEGGAKRRVHAYLVYKMKLRRMAHGVIKWRIS